MGGSPMYGGMWPEQASAFDLVSQVDAGAPTSVATDAAFIPSQVQPTPLGNAEADGLNVRGEPPAHISIRFMSPMGFRTVRIPWRPGLTVQMALEAGRRGDSIFRLSAKPMSHARVVGMRRVRMHDILRAGDLLKLNPNTKPFL